MSSATHVKEFRTSTGKVKFRAEVWYQGTFHTSKVFDLRHLAVAFKEKQLERAIRGELLPAAARRAERKAQAGLKQPMTYWAQLYVAKPAAKLGERHCDNRLAEYRLVGRLLADKTLADFEGLKGAQLIETLSVEWLDGRLPRSTQPKPADAPPPRRLASNTVRLRLTALMRIIQFAKSKLPPDARFELPALTQLFEFSLPPAHEAPRKREPSDSEFASLLALFGAESELGQFLRVVDETGCRLSEVALAKGSKVTFFGADDQVVGGCLTLEKHKTSKRIGPREIPLSLFAARILHQRQLSFGDGKLFPTLGNTDSICKQFDDACGINHIDNLLIKDFRRAFINRNKYCVAQVDLLNIVGKSSLLDAKALSDSERHVVAAVGHKSLTTTAAYTNPDIVKLSGVFTRTSRYARITNAPPTELQGCLPNASPERVLALQRQIADALEQLGHMGALSVAV